MYRIQHVEGPFPLHLSVGLTDTPAIEVAGEIRFLIDTKHCDSSVDTVPGQSGLYVVVNLVSTSGSHK